MNNGPSERRSPSSKLPNSLEMLRRLANFQYPDEQVRGEGQYITQELQDAFTVEARKATKNFWPELWEGREPLEVLRIARSLLRAFWCDRDERKRDWYIHRCRFLYRQFMIEREFREPREEAWQKLIEANEQNDREYARNSLSWIYAQMDRALDTPPPGNPFENALYALQERARKPSRAPRCCKRKDNGCSHPYFFASKKSRKFCSQECAHEAAKASKRESWDHHKAEWRTK